MSSTFKGDVGLLGNPRAALAFCDYLNAIEIAAEIEQRDNQFAIVVKESQQLEIAQQEFAEFLKNPNQDKYLAASWEHSQPQYQLKSQQNFSLMRMVNALGERAGWLTLTLIACSIIITFYIDFGANRERVFLFTIIDQTGSIQPIFEGQMYRLVSPIFMHFTILGSSFIHLGFNMIWLFDLGGQIEKKQSSWVLSGVVLFTAIVSNIAQLFFESPLFGGMSGVVYGLLGYIFTCQTLFADQEFSLARPVVIFMLGWLLLGYTGFLGPIANTAHLAGLLSGVFIALCFQGIKRIKHTFESR